MEARPSPERLRITPRSAVTAVGLLAFVLVTLRLVAASQRVLGWVLAAAGIAGLLHPLAAGLARRVPRGAAVGLVWVGILAGVGLVGYGLVDGVVREMDRLERAAPAAARRLEQRGRFSGIARDLRLAERTERFVEEAPERLRGGTPGEALRAAATRGVAYLATAVLSLFFLLHGPMLAAAAAHQVHDEQRRHRLEQVAVSAFRRGFGYAQGSVAMAVVAGAAAYALASWAGVPGAAPLSVWVALWDLVPVIGSAVGAVPIVVLAGVGNPSRGAALALAFLVYQLVETLVVQRRLERRTVRLGPFLTAAGGFAGLELYGIGGALVAVLVLALVVAALDEMAAPDAPLADRPRPARRRGRGRRRRRARRRKSAGQPGGARAPPPLA